MTSIILILNVEGRPGESVDIILENTVQLDRCTSEAEHMMSIRAGDAHGRFWHVNFLLGGISTLTTNNHTVMDSGIGLRDEEADHSRQKRWMHTMRRGFLLLLLSASSSKPIKNCRFQVDAMYVCVTSACQVYKIVSQSEGQAEKRPDC